MISVFLFWYMNSLMLKKIRVSQSHTESGREIINSDL